MAVSVLDRWSLFGERRCPHVYVDAALLIPRCLNWREHRHRLGAFGEVRPLSLAELEAGRESHSALP
jgi:hypothetical protein